MEVSAEGYHADAIRGAPSETPSSPPSSWFSLSSSLRATQVGSYLPGITNAISALSTWEFSFCPKPKELLYERKRGNIQLTHFIDRKRGNIQLTHFIDFSK